MKYRTLLIVATLALAACGDKPAEKKGAPPTLITVTEAKVVALEVSERTLGTLESVNDPKIGAEIAGKIVKVAVRAGESVTKGQLLAQIDPTDAGHQATADNAEITRLEALLAQQERVVAVFVGAGGGEIALELPGIVVVDGAQAADVDGAAGRSDTHRKDATPVGSGRVGGGDI